ncbi:MAG: ComEC/Rec2 family competence protein, partial [Eubacteriales bacterium]
MLKAIFKNRITDFRPIFFIAIYLALGILCGYAMETSKTAAYAYSGVALVLVITDGLKNKKLAVLLLYLMSFAAGLILISLETSTQPLPATETQVTGRVTDVTHYDTRSYYILDKWDFTSDGQTVSPNKDIRFATEDRSLVPGDVVTFTAKIELPDEKRNIGGFDERMYLLGKGIGYTAKGTVESVAVLGHENSPASFFYHISNYLKQTIDDIFPKRSAGIAKGLILGDKSDILEADYDVFKRGGTASILAVSGLHFGILSMFIFWVISLAGVARKPANIITTLFMILYAGIVGFSVSATRALIMGLAVVFANLLGKQKDYLSFLSAAFVISLII